MEGVNCAVALLIYTILHYEGAPDQNLRKVMYALFQHEGLLKSIVQWGFWGENRPDIVKELGVVKCELVVEWGRDATDVLIRNAEVDAEDEVVNRIRLETIATTSIVSKEYDPNCMISYVAGVIRMMKATGHSDYFYVIMSFIGIIDCVDKGVITEVIDFGMNYSTDYARAEVIAKISAAMIYQDTNIQTNCPSDCRVAFAIRAGLIEMCLSFMERFSDPTELLEAILNIGFIFKAVHSVSLHMKSAKAIRSKKNKIEEALRRLEGNATIDWKLLQMARCIVNLNGAYCCHCNKALERKEIKRCNGCDRMTYCSVDCQKEDWLNGHNLACCDKRYTDEQAGVFQGRIWPGEPESERNVAKMKALEINITMVQLKLYLENAESIRRQARYLGIPLFDCVVEFDLRQCPPRVTTRRYSDHYKSPEAIKSFEDTRSKENMTCLYISYYNFGSLEVSPFVMQRLFSHETLFKECQIKARARRKKESIERSK